MRELLVLVCFVDTPTRTHVGRARLPADLVLVPDADGFVPRRRP